MKPYLDLVQHILDHGERRDDRTGTGTLAIFGAQVRYDLRAGFPLLTTKKVLFSAVVRELLWFLRGSTNIGDDLTQHTPIWDAWADDRGELGPIYGHQWRNWGGAGIDQQGTEKGIDQLGAAVAQIKTNPSSRRIIVSAWNVADIERMALPPCHLLFQFYVSGRRLDCQLYQRSADMALGVPFNIASYALLTTLIAGECDLQPGFFIHTLGDAHIYCNHIEGLKRQLGREPYPLPRLRVAKKPLDEIDFDDIELIDYRHHPFIKFEVAV
jgi:thymidylate synthase